MNYKTHHYKRRTKGAVFIIALCAAFLMTSGCATLRKKFTREKKSKEEEELGFIPVLDPIDYPEKVTSYSEKYKHHYSLWKVWIRDLLQNIALDSSEKRQKYLLNQSIQQLEEMSVLLGEDKRPGINVSINNFQVVLNEYDKAPAMRNKNALKRKIERNESEVRNKYSPRILGDYWEH